MPHNSLKTFGKPNVLCDHWREGPHYMTATTFQLNEQTISFELEPLGADARLTITSSNNDAVFMRALQAELHDWETIQQRLRHWTMEITLENNQVLCEIHAPLSQVAPLLPELEEYLSAMLEAPSDGRAD